MLAYPLLALLTVVGADAGERMIIVDGQPTIRLSLAAYDLGRQDDLRRLERGIRSAAARVCTRGYRDATYPEAVACAKTAAAAAEAQLSVVVAHKRTASPLLAAITVTAPPK